MIYALPPAARALADLAHGADHALGRLSELRARAVAFGVAHHGTERSHAHGGPAHTHGASVDRLLDASDALEPRDRQAAPPPVDLAGHLPGRGAVAEIDETESGPAALAVSLGASDRWSRPPLPPPRA